MTITKFYEKGQLTSFIKDGTFFYIDSDDHLSIQGVENYYLDLDDCDTSDDEIKAIFEEIRQGNVEMAAKYKALEDQRKEEQAEARQRELENTQQKKNIILTELQQHPNHTLQIPRAFRNSENAPWFINEWYRQPFTTVYLFHTDSNELMWLAKSGFGKRTIEEVSTDHLDRVISLLDEIRCKW